MTTVVHCKRSKFDVYIGRPSKWGNPFEIGRDGNRKEVIAKYREWIVQQPHLMDSLEELRDKVLACSCKPQSCHGDVLVELLNPPFKAEQRPYMTEFFNQAFEQSTKLQ